MTWTLLGIACGGGGSTTRATARRHHRRRDDRRHARVFQGSTSASIPATRRCAHGSYPASPYHWAGYYLARTVSSRRHVGPASTRRSPRWAGASTVIYVGQQDWTQIPTAPASPNRAVDRESSARAERRRCRRVGRGARDVLGVAAVDAIRDSIEAADAVAKMRADGFPRQSVVFLDIEFVTTVTPALLDYYRGVDSRRARRRATIEPGMYAAKSNATTLHNAAAR